MLHHFPGPPSFLGSWKAPSHIRGRLPPSIQRSHPLCFTEEGEGLPGTRDTCPQPPAGGFPGPYPECLLFRDNCLRVKISENQAVAMVTISLYYTPIHPGNAPNSLSSQFHLIPQQLRSVTAPVLQIGKLKLKEMEGFLPRSQGQQVLEVGSEPRQSDYRNSTGSHSPQTMR